MISENPLWISDGSPTVQGRYGERHIYSFQLNKKRMFRLLYLGGFLIRPAVVVPVERYTPKRKAEFILSNATTEADYRQARKEVQKLGIDPDSIPHRRPA